jgi:hypothetical protein
MKKDSLASKIPQSTHYTHNSHLISFPSLLIANYSGLALVIRRMEKPKRGIIPVRKAVFYNCLTFLSAYSYILLHCKKSEDIHISVH